MKLLFIFFAAAAAALTARSDIVNGKCTAGEAGRTGNLRSISSIDKGWYTADSTVPHFEFSNGTITLNTVAATARPAAIGQFFTFTEPGDRVLNFDVAVTDGNANLDFKVQLYGYKQRTKEKTILFANAIKLESAEPPATSEYYEVKELANFNQTRCGTLSGGRFVTKSIPFTANAAYAFYGIRITANRPDADDKISFDNISITKPPEPDSAAKPKP